MDCKSCGNNFKNIEKLPCSFCEKIVCKSYCSVWCATCDAIVCHEHFVQCSESFKGCLDIVCQNCATEDKGWGHPECCTEGDLVCPPCKKVHKFVTCTACSKDVCFERQGCCTQGHHFCDPCYESHVQAMSTKDENEEILHFYICRWCLKGDRHFLCDPCSSCAQEHTLMACSGCDEAICFHTAEYCGKGHGFCCTCSWNMIVSLAKGRLVQKNVLETVEEQIVYKVCHLCLRK